MTTTLEIAVDKLVEDPNNVRTEYRDIDLLAKSIAGSGLLQPLTVKTIENGTKYLVIDGNRRLRALQKLNGDSPTTALCVLRDEPSDADITVEQLIVGLQRQDLSPVDQANGFAKALGMGVTQKDLAAKLGYTQPLIKSRLNLLAIPSEWRDRYIEDCGLTRAVELGAALAKYPTVTFDEVPDAKDTAQSDYPEDDWEEHQVTAEAVVKTGVYDQGVAKAEELADKLREAGITVSVEDHRHYGRDGRVVADSWVQLRTGEDEPRYGFGTGKAMVSQAELTKLRKDPSFYVIFAVSVGLDDKRNYAHNIRKYEFVTTPEVLPATAKPQGEKAMPAADRTELRTKELEAEKKRKAAEKQQREQQFARYDLVVNKKLTAAQRSDVLYLAVDELIEQCHGHWQMIAKLLHLEVPKDIESYDKAKWVQNTLADLARKNTVERDRVALAIVLAPQVGRTFSVEPALDKWVKANAK